MTETIDRAEAAAAEAFADRVVSAGLNAAEIFTIYIGEQLGLYRALADHGPLSRDELTRHAPIHWRYAQEWLEQQTVAGILTTDDPSAGPGERRYRLPAAQAEVLVEADSLLYLAPLARAVSAGALSLPALLEAFRTGGGVSWAELGDDVRTGVAEMNRPWYINVLGSEWIPAIPDLYAALEDGGHVADIACGEGWSSIGIALSHPRATVDGYDVDGPSVEAARRHAAEAGVSDRVHFRQLDVASLTDENAYDAVVGFEFLHDVPHPVEVLGAMRRIARPGAPIVVMDERVPDHFGSVGDFIERLDYAFSILACLPDSMSHQPSVATGTVMRLDTVRDHVIRAGFSDLDVLPIEHDMWRFYRMVW